MKQFNNKTNIYKQYRKKIKKIVYFKMLMKQNANLLNEKSFMIIIFPINV